MPRCLLNVIKVMDLGFSLLLSDLECKLKVQTLDLFAFVQIRHVSGSW